MSGINSLLTDTNILIYYLEGRKQVSEYAEYLFSISVISEIELLGVKNIPGISLQRRKSLINDCIILPFDENIKEITIEIMQQSKMKSPDAIIAATALKYHLPLLTADKAFKKISNLNLILLEF